MFYEGGPGVCSVHELAPLGPKLNETESKLNETGCKPQQTDSKAEKTDSKPEKTEPKADETRLPLRRRAEAKT
jgi:hypothetical protein